MIKNTVNVLSKTNTDKPSQLRTGSTELNTAITGTGTKTTRAFQARPTCTELKLADTITGTELTAKSFIMFGAIKTDYFTANKTYSTPKATPFCSKTSLMENKRKILTKSDLICSIYIEIDMTFMLILRI